MAKKQKEDDGVVLEIDNYELSEEDKQLFEATDKKDKQLCRWFITINNPFWGEENVEADTMNTDLEIKTDYYNLDYVKSFNNIDLFEFHYVEVTAIVDEIKKDKVLREIVDENGKKKIIEETVEKTEKVKKQIIVERPYFKSYQHFKSYLENLQVEGLKYSVGQVEKGHKENTTHLQFGVNFDDRHAKRFYTMKKYFPTAYLAMARGSNYDIKVYCTKIDTRVEEPFEIGKFVEMRKRTDYEEFYSALKSGASNLELMENFYTLFTTMGQDKIDKQRDLLFNSQYEDKGRNIRTTYIYGAPGTGKTKSVYKKYGFSNVFRVSYYGKFQFNGYKGQKVLLLDEFNGQINLGWLNQILDSYPIKLETKGGERIACFDTVIICSNYSFEEIYKEQKLIKDDIYNSVYRRIHFIYKYEKDNKIITEKDSEFEEIPKEEQELDGVTERVNKSYTYDSFGVRKCVYDYHKKIEQIQFVECKDIVDEIF